MKIEPLPPSKNETTLFDLQPGDTFRSRAYGDVLFMRGYMAANQEICYTALSSGFVRVGSPDLPAVQAYGKFVETEKPA